MITEDYCSYEIAMLLKRKGFNEPLSTFYFNGEFKKELEFTSSNENLPVDETCCVAPTHQMALKWLRETHNIIIIVRPHYVASINGCDIYSQEKYCYEVIRKGYRIYKDNYSDYTYETAVEAALIFVTKELIR